MFLWQTISNEPVADFQGKAGRYQRPKPVHMPPAPVSWRIHTDGLDNI